ncbi:MAG TPA: hypothetical protein VLT87_29885 [Thermoanaerobaculia bacterium]|nr:hypothetical protein [Thermoanaerobaculia bacterium]
MERARTLDRFLPEYRHNEVHETVIAASPEAVRRAVREVKGREIALARLLFGIRMLPGRLLGRRPPERDYEKTLLDSALAMGFIVLSESPDEIVLGVIGQFWKLTGEIVRLSGPEELLAFSREGYAKGAVDFTLEEQEDGRVRLRTETRVLPLGREAARRFGLYWTVVRPGSSLLRRSWLSAIRRRAESAALPAR